jgi:chromate reductase, NAD(P)H dehydrogenase (quinone)
MMVSNADEAFDGVGKMIDEKTRRRLAAFMEGFSAFVSERRR